MTSYDLGGGHAFSWVGTHDTKSEYSTTWPDGVLHENLTGIIDHHETSEGQRCGGYVSFKGFGRPRPDGSPGPEWDVISLDPLHIEPSLLCTACSSHGWIRNGVWQEA